MLANITNVFFIWLHSDYHMALWMGKLKQILHCDWLPEQARWSYLASLGLAAVFLIDQACSVKMAGSYLVNDP